MKRRGLFDELVRAYARRFVVATMANMVYRFIDGQFNGFFGLESHSVSASGPCSLSTLVSDTAETSAMVDSLNFSVYCSSGESGLSGAMSKEWRPTQNKQEVHKRSLIHGRSRQLH